MRPINNFALHAFAAAVLTAFATTSAAAQFLGDSTSGATGAARDGQTRYLALGDSIPGATGAIKNDGRGGGWIEIQGWDWGETRAGKATFNEFTITKKTDTASAPSGDMVMKGSKIGENAPASRGGVRVASGDVDGDGRADVVVAPRDSASGQATGKRQHLPIRARTYASPLDRGSVKVKVKFPWVDCAVGARYPVITLGDGARSYRLQDVTVASCGSAAGRDDGPKESITFVYGKLD